MNVKRALHNGEQNMLKKNMLKSYREKAEMTQEELAKKLDVTRQTIISIETGKYVPSLSLAFRISRLFGKKIEEIFWE
jgi:putative transcriptional regulator